MRGGERDLGKLEEFQLEFVLDTRNMDGVALLLFETCWCYIVDDDHDDKAMYEGWLAGL